MRIPLFPLANLVLFPNVMLPLHIFEQRYKQMINECVTTNEPFGLVQLQGAEETETTIAHVGVSARVVQVEPLEEGRMNILCAGESRFRIVHFAGNVPYWSASVEFFEDLDEPVDELKAAYNDVADLY